MQKTSSQASDLGGLEAWENQRPRLISTSDTTCTVVDEQGQSAEFPIYRHSPLPPGRTIRLLKLESQAQPWPLSRLSKMIEVSLIEYELEDTDVATLNVSNSPYIAASYFWGEPIYDAPLSITTQGQRNVLPITATAWEAIHRCLPGIGRHGKLLWIDQICINQKDQREKAQQVMLMGDIYRRCWCCMIWLGPADADTQAAFSLLDRLDETFSPTKPIPIDERQVADFSHAQIRAELASKLGKDLLPPPTDPGWVEIAKLLRKEWFTRLWTFQEAVLCYKGDASIVCGKHTTPVITFMRASMFLGHDHSFAGISHTPGRSALAQISSFRFQVERRQVTPLIWLLQNNNFRSCSEPNDRIYALLGLRHEDGPEFPIHVDYQKPPVTLFTEIARNIIQTQRSLRICAEAPERLLDSGISGLPSWVPDWTKTQVASTFELLNPSSAYFKASNRRIHVDNAQDPMVLTAEGKFVDKIVEIVDTEVPDAVTEEERRTALVEEVLPLLLATLQSFAPGRNHAQLSHIIINTITVGGYVRTNNLGNSGLQQAVWSEPVCDYMLSFILNAVESSTVWPQNVNPDRWLHALAREALICGNKKFALLKHNLLALVPALSKIGDSISILHGSSLPLVLRTAENGCFEMIGVCFVDKIMQGERVDWVSGDEFQIC